MNEMNQKIERCYDSHVHWLGTGDNLTMVPLAQMQGIESLRSLSIKPESFRDRWLLGFGWDEHRWLRPESVNRQMLDEVFPDHPVYFIRADSHAAWLNTLALKELEFWHPRGEGPHSSLEEFIPRADDGWPRGLLLEKAKFHAGTLLPEPTVSQCKALLTNATRTFHRAGFTHIRDMTCSARQWEAATSLDFAGELQLAVLQNFHVYNSAELPKILELARTAKLNQSPNLRVKGIKIFYDGSLGSETAYLSQCYCGRNHRGQIVYSEQEIREMVLESWSAGFEVCVHTIGDQAADDIVNLLQKMKVHGHQGSTHLEHVEILRPDTIAKMRDLSLTCHLQPCHWLSDKNWLAEKLGSLFPHVFPWAALENAGVPIFFGSDSPIEPPSVINNIQAVAELALQGISRPRQNSTHYQICPEPQLAEGSYTVFENGRVKDLFFAGQRIEL